MITDPALNFPIGLAIGLAAAAPVGPINLLVVQRILGGRFPAALALGIGGAFGDAVFASIAAFGLAAIAAVLDAHAGLFRIGGGVVMLVFALMIWRAAPRLAQARPDVPAYRSLILAFGMALSNPATMLFFFGSIGAVGFAGIGHDTARHLVNSGLLVAGVFGGSMLWWLIVAGITRSLRAQLRNRHLQLLNLGTALALAVFGIAAIFTGISER